MVSYHTYEEALNEKGICNLYHISDISNIPSILKEGILSRNDNKTNTS